MDIVGLLSNNINFSKGTNSYNKQQHNLSQQQSIPQQASLDPESQNVDVQPSATNSTPNVIDLSQTQDPATDKTNMQNLFDNPLQDAENLPDKKRIEDIFTHLSNFNISDKLPPNTHYIKTSADLALEQNINLLFKSLVSESSEIKESLISIVEKPDDLMNNTTRRKIEKRKTLSRDQKQKILHFYPNMMRLIKTILTHCNTHEHLLDLENHDKIVDKWIFSAWHSVMGELIQLYSVIVYANANQMIDLGNYPTEFKSAIIEMNQNISKLKTSINDIDVEITKLKEDMNLRAQEFEKIRQQHVLQEASLQLKLSDRQNINNSLENYTNVENMASRNIEQIHALSSD